ncbi:FliM/FliN family flagellar motor switch protein [Paracoccus gahaiensis]|uniref:FliM/FliN family flagellar motor switch protein n=1 Tax=Paracoccus gahaiensis TaxID=1706839 RepID=A0A4U0RCC2_9RHOB|nr:FliM/FliN family flagellar motor C-terminal domain-containing protein [Paracoccus gahaiensis]TJZ92973.1 FliM/FliN family flagellar motor switch protein [Paracoccus gahaiensis]
MIQPDPNECGEGVLRRMLRVRSQARLGQGGAPQLPSPAAPTPARAAATAIGRAADRLYKLPVRTLSVRPGALTLAELPELLPELPLIAVLQGPGDRLGALALCPQAVAGLVEWQALGRVTSRGLERRRPSRSDALLCAEFIDTFLKELPAEMEGVEGFEAVAGFSFMTHLDDPRPLSLMLEDVPFRSLSFDLGIGAPDMREGKLLLALPQPAGLIRPRGEGAVPLQMAAPVAPPPPPPRPTLAAAMQEAPVQLSAILCRRRISLAELRGLTQGRLLTLPRNSLTQATLETAGGQVLATGKLGEADGCHALRLRDPTLPMAGEDGDLPAGAGLGGGAGLSGMAAPQDLAAPDPFRTPGGAAPVIDFPAMTGLTLLGG